MRFRLPANWRTLWRPGARVCLLALPSGAAWVAAWSNRFDARGEAAAVACTFWPTSVTVNEGYPTIAGRREPPVLGGRRGQVASNPHVPCGGISAATCAFWSNGVPENDAYPGIEGSRTCLRVVAGVKPQAKPHGEASAAACAFWRASTQRSTLALAGSIPQRYLRPRAATEVQPRRPSSHSPAAVLWWPPSREPVATSG